MLAIIDAFQPFKERGEVDVEGKHFGLRDGVFESEKRRAVKDAAFDDDFRL